MRYMLIMRSTPEAEEAAKDIPFEQIIEDMGKFNGFWILQVSSKEEAAQWASRAPLGPGVKLEVRRVSEVEDFPQDNDWIQKEVQWREQLEAAKKL